MVMTLAQVEDQLRERREEMRLVEAQRRKLLKEITGLEYMRRALDPDLDPARIFSS